MLRKISGSKDEADKIIKFKFTITYIDDVCTNIKVSLLETENPGDTGKGIREPETIQEG